MSDKIRIEKNLYKVIKESGEEWYFARFKVLGKVKIYNLTRKYDVKGIRDARRVLNRLKVQAEKDRFNKPQKDKRAVVKIIEDALSSRERTDRPKFKRYSYTYGSTFNNHIKPFMNPFTKKVTEKDLKKIKEHLDKKGYGEATFKKVKMLLLYSKEANPEFKVPEWFKATNENRIKRGRKYSIFEIFPEGDLEQVVCDLYNYFIGIENKEVKYPLLLMLKCGRRVNETLELRKKDVNFTRNTITAKVTKNNKPSTYPVPVEVMEYIKSKLLKNDDYIFNITENTLRYYFKKALKKTSMNPDLGKGVNLHKMRNLLASILLYRNKPYPVIQAILSHTTAGVTALYAEPTPKHKKEVLEYYWDIVKGVKNEN